MHLVDLVAVSRDLSATSSRNAKTVLIADLLTRAAQETRASAGASGPPGPDLGVDEVPAVDEIELVVRYLSGAPRQRRTGIELTHLTALPPPATVASVTLAEVLLGHVEASLSWGTSRLPASAQANPRSARRS